MTKLELTAFRKTLEAKQAELGNGKPNRDDLAINASSDELDRIQNAGEREYAMGSLERNAARMREVRAALGRLDEGSFGICQECETAINPKRLAAVPWASFCIACQEAADLAAKSGDDELADRFEVAA